MTEVYVPNSDSNSADRWPEALEVAHNMHNALVEEISRHMFGGISAGHTDL